MNQHADNSQNEQHPGNGRAAHNGLLDEKTFSKYFLLVFFAVALLAFLKVIRIFLLDIVLATTFATLFYPVFARLLKLLRGRRGLSAFFSCVIIILGILIPLAIITNILIVQGIDLYHTAEPRVSALLAHNGQGVLGRLAATPLGRWMAGLDIDWNNALSSGAKFLGNNLAKILNKTSQVTIGGVVHLAVILFSTFYFLRDGHQILKRLRAVIPLEETYKNMLIDRFVRISRATVKGTFVIALVQSTLGTLALWFFGVNAWMVWGVVMLVFAVIPMVGTGGVLIPAGVIKIISGETAAGIALILFSVLVVSTIDNLIRPRLVGKDAGLHDLVVFFSSLGGIVLFGPAGFIVGPLIAALFFTVLDIFSIEFQGHIGYPNKE